MRSQLTLIISFALSLIGYFHARELILISALFIYIHIAFPSISEKISYHLGNVISKIFKSFNMLLLSLIYILILTPIGILFRRLKGDSLFLKKEGLKSTFKEKNHLFTFSDFENPY